MVILENFACIVTVQIKSYSIRIFVQTICLRRDQVGTHSGIIRRVKDPAKQRVPPEKTPLYAIENVDDVVIWLGA